MADGNQARQRVLDQVEDAYELASYVIENGVLDHNGQPISVVDLKTIQTTAAKLGYLDGTSAGVTAATPGNVTSDEWNAFEEAYYRLTIATHPVTAETLRDTADSSSRGSASLSRLLGRSPAQRFTRMLLVVTFAFAAAIIILEAVVDHLNLQADANRVLTWRNFWQSLLPWLYGGLGACAYLLRSAHSFIYQRCFDVRRIPEYSNRILLGAVSGGAIILFANYLAAQNDTFTHFASAALGFIAGYSTDFLFNTIERIVTAIFPKVDIQTVPQGATRAIPLPIAKRADPGGPDGGEKKEDKAKLLPEPIKKAIAEVAGG